MISETNEIMSHYFGKMKIVSPNFGKMFVFPKEKRTDREIMTPNFGKMKIVSPFFRKSENCEFLFRKKT